VAENSNPNPLITDVPDIFLPDEQFKSKKKPATKPKKRSSPKKKDDYLSRM
jgi:hypothetical protein